MSLNWSIEGIKDYKELLVKGVDKDGEFEHTNPVTDGLVWMTMIVDIGRITEKNWKEFYLRAKMYEALKGRYFYECELTPEMIHRHIGLYTNVSDNKRNWNRKVRMWLQEKIEMGDTWDFQKWNSERMKSKPS